MTHPPLLPNSREIWPDLSSERLEATLTTLHLWSQVVGKVRLMLTPWENHGWHVPLYLSARGMTTGLIPLPGRPFSLEFDFISGALIAAMSDGSGEVIALAPQSVATFYEAVQNALRRLGVTVELNPVPVELPDAIRFDQDHKAREFDLAAAIAYWRALLEVQRVFQLFRTRFTGKCSPIHLFWGSFDLAVTRFSGRSAPIHAGGAPHMPASVAREAYCQEVSSCGFWPNLGGGGPAFYSYAYPAPAGFGEWRPAPLSARFDPALGEFILSYAAVRHAPDPENALLAFLQTTYDAAADLGHWDRGLLEREQGGLGRPPRGS